MATKFNQIVLLFCLQLGALIQQLPAQSQPTVPKISITSQEGVPGSSLVALRSPAVVQVGTKVIFTTEVHGPGPLYFQWFKNGAIMDGITNASLMIDSLELPDEGDYSVAARNASGTVRSESAQLYVSNIRPNSYISLTAGPVAPTNGQVLFSEALGPTANWLPLSSVPGAPDSQFIAAIPASGKRFYLASGTNGLSARFVYGWANLEPTGSVHSIEFLAPGTSSVRWRTLDVVTNTRSPSVYVDSTATNSVARRYRRIGLSIPNSRRAGLLLSTVAWILPPEVYSQLTPGNRADFSRLGVSFNDPEHALQFPTNALAGYWVVVGDQRVMTDTNGAFEIDVAAGVTDGYIVRSYGSSLAEAEATFPVAQLSALGQKLSPIVIRYERSGDLDMDGTSANGLQGRPQLAEVICGNPGVHIGNQSPCCLDYNGVVPTDCKDTTGGITSSRILHYIGSTCFKLVNAGLCHREYNSHAIGFRGPGLNCFSNHKYRNCQNVDRNPNSALTLSANVLSVQCGKTIEISVHNNSAANETEFFIGPFSWKSLGVLSGQRVSARSSAAFTLRHYEESAPAAFHVENDVILYTAPKADEMPPGVTELKLWIQATAGGVVRRLDITVTCGGCDDNPSVIPIPNMVPIPAGTFVMGSPLNELDRVDNEVQHPVTISRAFCMGKYEVTQAEYLDVMGLNPSYFSGESSLPVERVSWFDAVNYCSRLTAREHAAGRLPVGWAYRLPTEAEWEYACRAGTTTPFHYGSALRSGMANFDGRFGYPENTYDPSGQFVARTVAVGSYAANSWGLYDMHGNVWEWCLDWYGEYPTGTVTDPKGPTSGIDRVIRGGGWSSHGRGCRAAVRYNGYPVYWSRGIGFRVVLAPGP